MDKIDITSFVTEYPVLSNILINEVHVSSFLVPPPDLKPTTINECGAKKFNAIWDTGATNTSITKNVVNSCNLKPIGITKVYDAGGFHLSNVYLIGLFLPNRIIIPELKVTESILIGDCDILIGMDIINQGDFAVTNYNGKTVFSFRMPSIETMNFNIGEKKTFTRTSQKIGRNDPCPCGSGKKYKNCCGSHLPR